MSRLRLWKEQTGPAPIVMPMGKLKKTVDEYRQLAQKF